MNENEGKFNEVCDLLHAGHASPSRSTPTDTLNCLFQKHLRSHIPEWSEGSPSLSPDNVAVSVELWPKEELWNLDPVKRTRPLQGDEHHRVVIIRYKGRNCLIDGGRRISRWNDRGDKSDHEAWVLTVC